MWRKGVKMEIRENELCNITGGAIKIAGWLIGGGIFTLIVGIIDGFFRPLVCHK